MAIKKSDVGKFSRANRRKIYIIEHYLDDQLDHPGKNLNVTNREIEKECGFKIRLVILNKVLANYRQAEWIVTMRRLQKNAYQLQFS